MANPYLNDEYPCFGTHDRTDIQCFDCPHKIECRSDTEEKERAEKEERIGRRTSVAPRVRRATQTASKIVSPQNTVMSARHLNFTPYPGETQFSRFSKNLMLNMGGTLGTTITDFCVQFEWRPRIPAQDGDTVLRVVKDVEPEKEE